MGFTRVTRVITLINDLVNGFYWGYNPYKWNYFGPLLITGDFEPTFFLQIVSFFSALATVVVLVLLLLVEVTDVSVIVLLVLVTVVVDWRSGTEMSGHGFCGDKKTSEIVDSPLPETNSKLAWKNSLQVPSLKVTANSPWK